MKAAPIDGKNVSSDWIEDVFEGNYAYNGYTYLGFVKDSPVMAEIEGNTITWRWLTIFTENDELIARLTAYDTEDSELACEYKQTNSAVKQTFYFKD